jgi:lactate permease
MLARIGGSRSIAMEAAMWSQVYDPLNNPWLSTLTAAIPVVVLLGSLAWLHMKAHFAALLGLASALAIAILVYGMPGRMAAASAAYGAAFGLLPIGWIILNIIFLYQLTEEKGYFAVLRDSIAGVSDDRRIQLLLIAFCFGAFFEGAAGFGTPVAVTGAILIGLGFRPLAASGLSLIANTAPVAFGALGTPIIALAAVTGLDLQQLSGMVGRQLPFFSVLVPFWLIWAFAGWRGMLAVWPAILVAGVSFAIPQYLVSNFHGPWLVDVVAALVSMGCLVAFLRVWHPRETWRTTTPVIGAKQDLAGEAEEGDRGLALAAVERDASLTRAAAAPGTTTAPAHPRSVLLRAWLPWIVLSVFVFLWGAPQVKAALDNLSSFKWPVPELHNLVQKVPPVVAAPAKEAAVFAFNYLSATGTGILLAALVAGIFMRYSPLGLLRTYWRTLKLVRYSLLTIAAMLALGFTTRYSGTDATLGLAFAHAGWLYPFFGAMLGWLGVALTGSDTSSNVLFGGLQKITAQQIGLDPVLMAAANSSGGVMGKMIDAQSIVVASTATKWFGHEGDILRFVFFHSLALAALVGVLVMLQAYVYPFTLLVR